jgi:hypothetical protein
VTSSPATGAATIIEWKVSSGPVPPADDVTSLAARPAAPPTAPAAPFPGAALTAPRPFSIGAALASSALNPSPVLPVTAAPSVAAVSPMPVADTGRLAPDGGDQVEALRHAYWTCSRCAAENTYAQDACPTCGTSLFEPLAERRKAIKTVDEKSVILSAAVPGGGFFRLGLNGAGVARLLLVAWALGTALFLPGRVMALKILFLLAGLAVWAVSASDALATRRGATSGVILRNKAIVGVVVGLLLVLFIGMVAGTRASTTSPNSGDSGVVVLDPSGQGLPPGG